MKKKIVEKYLKLSRAKGHGFHRYKSWDHCYNAFGSSQDIDYLALNLASYLASWGMYRGSSFLLEYDYKVHESVVEILLKHITELRGIEIDSFSNEKASQIFGLHQEISEYYNTTLKKYRKNDKEYDVRTSDVLSTKIMLGSLGCIPAYDRFFQRGLKECGLCQSFSKNKPFHDLIDFISARNNNTIIKELSSKHEMPFMKILDMYFWQLGYDEEARDKGKDLK